MDLCKHDHDDLWIPDGSHILWCTRCGSIRGRGEWRKPELLVTTEEQMGKVIADPHGARETYVGALDAAIAANQGRTQ